MKTLSTRLVAFVVLSAVLASPVAVSAEGLGPTVTAVSLNLVRNTLTNVPDAAGLWQFEGGYVLLNNQRIANYAAHRRVVTGGTDAQNTAMLTLTIFVIGANPPENVTLQGSHDYSSGKYIGSVSGASAAFSFLNGATFAGDAGSGTLTLTY